MILKPKDNAARKEYWRELSAKKKAGYILTYYRLPILVGLAALAFVSYMLYRHFTDKEPVLYTAYVNVSVGEDLDARLNEGFIAASGADPRKEAVYLYRGLYLSDSPSQENHQYSYASRLKVLASIQAQQFDVALMNQEAYDILSHEGYLLALPDFLSEETGLLDALEPYLAENSVILEDNSIEYELNEADQYVSVEEKSVNAIEVSRLPIFSEAGFSGSVYLGVIGNSPRLPSVLQYIDYLTFSEPGAPD